jgi:hypothetical protein
VRRHRQFLNTFPELIGCPISMSFTTGFSGYYEPLRHPGAPSLSLAGVQFVVADHALGLPMFRALSLCTCCRHYPGAATGRIASLTPPSRISLPRYGSWVGLRIVLFEACSAFTRVTACTLALSPYFVTAIRRLQLFRYLHSCSGCFRLGRCRVGLAPTGKRRLFHGARHEQKCKPLRRSGSW